MYTVWHTEHEINKNVTSAFHEGMMRLSRSKTAPYRHVEQYRTPENSISYGILRGTGEIFKDCIAHNKEFWEIDRGYFKPRHYDGYYRISLNGTRACYRNNSLSRDRFDALGLSYSPWKMGGGHILICPPTDHVADFMGKSPSLWIENVIKFLKDNTDRELRVRNKNSKVPLSEDLKQCHCLVTFNSNVAIDALLTGVPVISTERYDINPWNGVNLSDIESDKLYLSDRERLFSYLAYCQFTIDEIRTGRAWELCQEVQKYG